jgi:hypothetical protein
MLMFPAKKKRIICLCGNSFIHHDLGTPPIFEVHFFNRRPKPYVKLITPIRQVLQGAEISLQSLRITRPTTDTKLCMLETKKPSSAIITGAREAN